MSNVSQSPSLMRSMTRMPGGGFGATSSVHSKGSPEKRIDFKLAARGQQNSQAYPLMGHADSGLSKE